MTDYTRMTKADLITRLTDLEGRIANVGIPSDRCKRDAVEPDGKFSSDSERRLHAILETGVEGIITIDEHGLIESANPAAERIFGYQPGEIIGKNVSLLMPSPGREAHDRYLANYLHTGEARVINVGRETVALRKDGTTFPIHLSLSEVRLADRRLFTGFIRDISERKAAAETLGLYRAIVESSEDAIIGKTLDGRITSWNKGAETLFGYAREEVLGRHISIILSPDRVKEEPEILAKIKRGESVDHYETVWRRKSGELVRIAVIISPIREPGGKIIGASSVARDVTARQRAEEQLKLLSEALESAANGIAITDVGGQILWVNPAFAQLTGYDRTEAVGQNPRFLKSGKHPTEFYRQIWETILRGEPWQGEMVNRRKDGSLYPEEMTITPVRAGGGGITHFVAVKQDITGRKRAEEQLASLAQALAEKNKELETIVYVASHDLRSPLVNIQGFSRELVQACEALRKLLPTGGQFATRPEVVRLLHEDIPEAIRFIQAGVTKIDSLLAGFLRYSRLGRRALKIEQLDMDRMLAGIAQAMEFQIKQAGALLSLEPLPGCLGDATQTSQVFSNLLDNSVKYLDPRRAGRILVTGSRDGDRAIYTIRDNGIGIMREHQNKVFEIFHRLNPSHGEGEGLGLTIAQRILARQNGKIWMESKPGKGAAFFVSLPAV